MFYFGGVAVIAQTLLVRELMVSFYGSEFALAAALACWLAFMPLGAVASAALLRRSHGALGVVLTAAVGLGLLVPGQFLMARLIRALLGVEPGAFVSLPGIVLCAALCAGPAGFLVGFLFPAACRYEGLALGHGGRGIGRMYVAEALGSCAGGALMSFVLLPHQSPAAIAFITGVLWLLACGMWFAGGGDARGAVLAVPVLGWMLLLAAFGDTGARMFAVAVCCLPVSFVLVRLMRGRASDAPLRGGSVACLMLAWLLSVGFVIGGTDVERWSLEQRWRTFSRFDLVESFETRYQHIDFGRREGLGVVVQNGVCGDVFPNESETREAAALLLTQHPDPHDVLVIGGGLGGLCQELLRPRCGVDYVEMDPEVIFLYRRQLPRELLGALQNYMFEAYFEFDGRRFVRTAPLNGSPSLYEFVSPRAPYDIVLINVGNPTSASSNRFHTVEFFREVRRVLAPGGVVALWGVAGNAEYLQGPRLRYDACIYKTLRQVFPRVIVRPGDEFRFFASDGPGVTTDPEVLAARFDRLRLEPPEMKHMFASAQFPPERVKYVRERLEAAAGAAPVNSDDRPIAFTLFLRVQEHFSRTPHEGPGGSLAPDTGGFFAFVLTAKPWWLLVPLAVCLLVVVVAGRVRGPAGSWPWSAGFCIVTTGLFGLSAEALLIYAYQTHFGYVYRDVSLLVGAFMLGIAGGAALAGKASDRAAGRTLAGFEVLQVLWLLALPWGIAALSTSPVFFIALSLLAGILTGGEFPLACRLGLQAGRETASVAAMFSAADYGGAVAGAVLTGLVLMPAFGLAAGSTLIACAKCASLIGLLAAVGTALRPRTG